MTRRRARSPMSRSSCSAVEVLWLAVLCAMLAVPAAAHALDASAPSTPVKLVFVHHSTGEAWLSTADTGTSTCAKGLGCHLKDNNYFASDTNYGWGPDSIGDRTDVGHWWSWFRGPSAGTYTAALYAESGQHSSYERLAADPGGQNTIVMFKSCFPNSNVSGSPADAVPAIGSNPLKGGSGPLTVGNAKGVYLDLLEYFRTRPDKLFVLVVSPPLRSVDTDPVSAANARHLADWLVSPDGWLKDYPLHNVVAWDYFTVLTGGHHRVAGDSIEHTPGPSNYLIYPTGDSHPSAAGHAAAAAEFVPYLNAAYHAWSSDSALPPANGGAPAVKTVTSITIKTDKTSVYRPKPFILSGVLTGGSVGELVVAWVKKPGKSYWSYSSNRLCYSLAPGGANWWYRYTPTGATSPKGTYYFKSSYPGTAAKSPCASPNIVTVRVR